MLKRGLQDAIRGHTIVYNDVRLLVLRLECFYRGESVFVGSELFSRERDESACRVCGKVLIVYKRSI